MPISRPTLLPSCKALASALPILAAALLAAGPAAAQAPIVQVPGGQPTLTAAITAVPDGGIIQLAAGTYTAPTGGFMISNPNKRFTIRAAPSAVVVLSGNNTQPVLRYAVNSAPARGHVIFEDLVFRNGRSAADGVAGGVTLIGGSQATFRRCTFENNTSQAPTTGGGGAAVFNGSRAFFIDCLFQNNTAKNEGAGLRAGENIEVYVHRSRFLGNSCGQPGHRDSAAGGGMHVTNGKVWVTNTRFENNRAGYTGGGFYILGSWQDPVTTPRAEATIANCTFVGNKADNDPGVTTPGPTEGGAFHAEDQATARIYNSRFFKNDADLGGGVSQYRSIANVKSSVFFGNRSLATGGFGGAIKSNSEDGPLDGANNRRSVSLTVDDSLFVGRYDGVTTVAEKGGGVFTNGDGNRAWGGGGVSQQGTVASNRATATISESAFMDLDVANVAGTGGAGGGIEASQTNLSLSRSLFGGSDAMGSGGTGGGARIVIGSSATVVDSTFVGNSATLFGGGLYIQGAEVGASANNFLRNEISPGVNEGIGSSFGAGLFAAQLDAAPFNISQTGIFENNLFSENIGLPIFDDDRNGPVINDQRYDDNRIYSTTFGAQVYTDSLVGPKTVAELNSLVVTRTNAASTDKSPDSNNTSLGSQPNAGMLLAVPNTVLAEGAAGDLDPPQAYLAYGWSGSGAILDGSNVSGLGNWRWLASFPSIHLLNVGGALYSATITAAPIPQATLEFSPSSISAGGNSTLSWSVDEGTFLSSAIDQQVNTAGAASGSTVVSANVTRPYTLLVITEQGGALAEENLYVGEVPGEIFDDGFESGNTSGWDQTLP